MSHNRETLHSMGLELAMHALGSAGYPRFRHHALGMLQGEISEVLRIHIWHPDLVRMEDPLRAVHDHRFDLVSTVLVGAIDDVPYGVVLRGDLGWKTGKSKIAHLWSMTHAKVQAVAAEPLSVSYGLVVATPDFDRRYPAGTSYSIERRRFHTTRVSELTVTVVHRSNFDDGPARVLTSTSDPPASGIVPAWEGGFYADLIAQAKAAVREAYERDVKAAK